MKKILILGLAAATIFSACSNDESVQKPAGKAISFKTYIDKSVKSVNDPSFTMNNLDKFQVWAFMTDNNGKVLEAEEVSKGTPVWTYTNTAYWVADKTYYFGAIAPSKSEKVTKTAMSVENGTIKSTIDFTTDGNTDLIYAYQTQTTAADIQATKPSVVDLTFNHLLSKVKFKFINDMKNDLATIKVTNIQITDAAESGSAAITANGVGTNCAWTANAATTTLNFGNVTTAEATANAAEAIPNGLENGLESYNEQLLIPATKSYTVTFTAELIQGETSIGTYNHTVTVPEMTLKNGYSYCFVATLNPENINPEEELLPIEFNVIAVNDWTPDTNNYNVEFPKKDEVEP